MSDTDDVVRYGLQRSPAVPAQQPDTGTCQVGLGIDERVSDNKLGNQKPVRIIQRQRCSNGEGEYV